MQDEIHHGREGAVAAATHPAAGIVVSALVGALGLGPTLRAIAAGKDIAFANKEVLVMAGEIVTAAARERGVACCRSTASTTRFSSAWKGAAAPRSSASS